MEQEVETALARERGQDGQTVLFPVRIDDAVIESKAGWPALLKNTRNIGDFTGWKDDYSYQRAVERLLRDLKAEEAEDSSCMTPDSLGKRAVLSPRNTILEEWDEVESCIAEAASRNGLTNGEELVSHGQLINRLYEAGKVSEAVREEFFSLSKWHSNVAFNSLSPVEPGMAITFANKARELQKTLVIANR